MYGSNYLFYCCGQRVPESGGKDEEKARGVQIVRGGSYKAIRSSRTSELKFFKQVWWRPVLNNFVQEDTAPNMQELLERTTKDTFVIIGYVVVSTKPIHIPNHIIECDSKFMLR